MTNLPQKQRQVAKRKKTDEEEMLAITEELMGGRKPLDFASYQREIAQQTPNWPIEDPDKVFERIIWAAKAGVASDKHSQVLQAAQILRALAELCDYVPLSLERLANISTSQIPETQQRIEDAVDNEHSDTRSVEEGAGENTNLSDLRLLGNAGSESDSPD